MKAYGLTSRCTGSDALCFVASALASQGLVTTNQVFARWFQDRVEAHRFVVEPIALNELDRWRFDQATGRIAHETGKFFVVDGVRIEQRSPERLSWDQPILHQAEIGILGFVVKRFDGVLHFLVQAKMEPGNLHYVQVSPTVQATRSNFTRVHQGRAPDYLEYFLDMRLSRVMVDCLQSEQGSRFWRKLNRNIVVEAQEDVPLRDDYCWLTLGQLNHLLRQDNVVNMDARTVLSCLPLAAPELEGWFIEDYPKCIEAQCGIDRGLLRVPDNLFEAACLMSLVCPANAEAYAHTLRWLSRQRFGADQSVTSIAPREMRNWTVRSDAIAHDEGRFFRVIGVRVDAANREIGTWCQPIVQPASEGLMACFTRQTSGQVEVLLQSKPEPGNADTIELGPSVQCFRRDHREADLPSFTHDADNPDFGIWHVNTLQSEEGGRFYREANRNRIIEVGGDWLVEPPDSYRWVPLNQLRPMAVHSRILNVEARCLLASLGAGTLAEGARSRYPCPK